MTNTSWIMRYRFLLLFAIVAIGGFLRFYLLADLPTGLYPDEAMNGLDALHALEQANFQVFYSDNNGREGLYINLMAWLIQIVGPSAWAVRALSALVGTATLLAVAFLAYEIGLRFAKEFSQKNEERYATVFMLVTTLLLSLSVWHIHFSRIGFRAILLPLLASAAVAYLLRGLRRRRAVDMALSGLTLGLSLATYIASRILPVVMIIPIGFALWKKRDRRLLRNIGIMAATFLLTTLPLLGFFVANPGTFMGRASDVSVLTAEAPLATLVTSTAKTLGMFHVFGDWNWRHGVSGQPLLGPIMGLLFLLGLGVLLLRLRRSRMAWLLLGWLGAMLLPAALSVEGLPHALRAFGATIPTMLIAAVGALWMWDFLKNRFPSQIRAGIVSVVVVAMMLFSVHQYFFTWGGNRVELDSAFRGDLTRASDYLNDRIVYRAAEYQDLFQSDPENTEALTKLRSLRDYVVVNEPQNVLLDGVPMPVAVIRYLTADHPDIVFLGEDRIQDIIPVFGRTSVLVTELPGIELAASLQAAFPSANRVEYDGFTVYEL